MREEYILKELSDFLKRTGVLFIVLVSRVKSLPILAQGGTRASACLSAPLSLALQQSLLVDLPTR